MYAIKKAFQGNRTLCTLCNGKLVALNESFEHHIPAGKDGPARTKVVALASQAQLGILFAEGNPCIEAIPEAPTPKEDEVTNTRKSKKERAE